MTTGQFMDNLERLGVVFAWVDGEIVIQAPPGALSDAQRDELGQRYDEVERLVCVALGPYEPVVELSQPTAPTQTTWEAA